MYKIVYTKQAQKDAKKISQAGLKHKAKKILELLKNNPYKSPPAFEKLLGDLSESYSRRINIQHRLIYQVFEDKKIVKVLRMWTHYQ